MFQITITKIGSSYEARVGCGRFFLPCKEALACSLKAFLDDPEAKEKDYYRWKDRGNAEAPRLNAAITTDGACDAAGEPQPNESCDVAEL